MSRLQIKAAAFLVAAFLLGGLIRFWQKQHPLPEVDNALVERFQEVADSLNAAEKAGPLLKADSGRVRKKLEVDFTPVNINQASRDELIRLPGIGPVLAQRIIEFRNMNGPFTEKKQLLQVKGIGPRKLQEFIDKITF